MSMGPFGVFGSAAGAPYAQNNSSATQRASQDTSAQQRQQVSVDKADSASGIGEADSDEATGERDADGRRIWEAGEKKTDGDQAEDAAEDAQPRARDATDTRGTRLDLSG